VAVMPVCTRHPEHANVNTLVPTVSVPELVT
jgi:hypothetical protein